MTKSAPKLEINGYTADSEYAITVFRALAEAGLNVYLEQEDANRWDDDEPVRMVYEIRVYNAKATRSNVALLNSLKLVECRDEV